MDISARTQTQSKILSKHHLSAARSLWQTQSKILSMHHLSEARSLWSNSALKVIFKRRYLTPVRAKKTHDRKDGIRRLDSGGDAPLMRVRDQTACRQIRSCVPTPAPMHPDFNVVALGGHAQLKLSTCVYFARSRTPSQARTSNIDVWGEGGDVFFCAHSGAFLDCV